MWHTGLVAPWHVGSSRTRARTRVPCIGTQIPNHCATREAHFSYFFFFFLIYLFMVVLGLCFCARASFNCDKWGPLFIAVRGPLTVAASLVVEHRLQTRRLIIVAHGPSCSTACGIFPDQGSNPCPLHWQADSQPLRHQGSPPILLNVKKKSCIYGSWPKVFDTILFKKNVFLKNEGFLCVKFLPI